jgi:hypothetical protein
MLNYTGHRRIDMRSEPSVSEKWLQDRIVSDPSLLLLGDVEVKDIERRQPRAGRLDLLLQDVEANTRYEVEMQLGATDESHIIRTIEYWDQERRRYPQYEHIAVIVAEEITARFFNVISLLNGQIPIVALQVQLIEVGDVRTLVFTKVLDHVSVATEEEESEPTDRAYWISQKSNQAGLDLADRLLEVAQEADPSVTLNYNKHYIGLYSNGRAKNFMNLQPRRSGGLIASFRLPYSDAKQEELEKHGFDVVSYDVRWKRYRLRLTKADIRERRDELVSLAIEAERHHAGAGVED